MNFKKKISVYQADVFNTSISDLMSGLLAIFILVLCYFILNFSQATAQLSENDTKRAEILLEIQDAMKEAGVDVIVDQEHGILRIPEGILFDVGSADIKPAGHKVIKKLSSVMEFVLSDEKFKGSVETVFIEGHTDNMPINNAFFSSNWDLSTKRAINTWNMMKESEPGLNNLVNRNNQKVFSCSGYADTRPVDANNNVESRRQNRRIDIRFSMSPPRVKDVQIVKFVREQMKNNG